MKNGEWFYSPEHGEFCQVVETQTLWGETFCRIWLPTKDIVVRVSAQQLQPVYDAADCGVERIVYLAAACKIIDTLTQDVLLAPLESSVIPLPHQIRTLYRAISGSHVRYLLADEVGLGKTIEAGLIMKELKLRGLVKRTLVVAPKGLVNQWVAEMNTHFGEEFRLLIPSEFTTSRGIFQKDNFWRDYPQVVCSMDSVKPLDARSGWSEEKVAQYNRERFEDLISAGWDLVIVDEAHRLGGSTDQVARYKLGKGLAEAAPYLLLLSATPHQGKTQQFHRLISLLDPQGFPDPNSVTKERVKAYVIRTEKRWAIDAEGNPLFKPRHTELVPVSWEDSHREQRLLYEAVTEYVRKGYNKAIAEKRNYIGFLMLLMQRLVVSSTRAIKTTLARRLEVLSVENSGLSQRLKEEQIAQPASLNSDDFYDLDGEELRQLLLRNKEIKNEKEDVRVLLEAATRCEARGPDAKAEALLEWVYGLQAQEGDPNLKILVFTEFVPTQEMLYEFLTERGFTVVCLNGSMDMQERKRVQKAFAKDARILISTDAGGEGLNLQFCHVVINYDIPWNPMRLEQRIGRVDRIGQKFPVRAINFVFKDSVEHRVLEVLEEKLSVIFKEFGIDKTGDVLDSAQAGQLFDGLYIEAITNPQMVDNKVDEVMKIIEEQAKELRHSQSLFCETYKLDPGDVQRIISHPLPHWVEVMTTSYLRGWKGGAQNAGKKKPDAKPVGKEGRHTIWHLIWPDGHEETVCFTHHALSASYLGLENTRVRGLAMNLPPFVPGQPIPVITLPDLDSKVVGYWSLWEISIYDESSLGPEKQSFFTRKRCIMPLFLSEHGKMFALTARHIWDQLLTTSPTVLQYLDKEKSQEAFLGVRKVAEDQGKSIYKELEQGHREYLAREREKGEYAFAARRRAIERIGLPQVRNHRLCLLEQEEQNFRKELERKERILPEMVPLLIVRVVGGAHG